MSKHILISGATGNIGTALVGELKKRGLDFTIMTSRPPSDRVEVPVVTGDFSKPETLVPAFKGVETLFLLLPLVPDMVTMGRAAIAAAREAGVRHVVRSSGGGADPASPVAIARAHGEIDAALQASGLAWTLLRPSSFMQNHLTFNAPAIRQGALYAPHGEGATAIIDVRDIAECAAIVLADPAAHAGRIYDLTGGEALTDAQQMAEISRVIGREVNYVDVPESAAEAAMRDAGMPALVIEWLMSLNDVIKAGYTAGISDSVRQLTGHPPRRFADFVREYQAAWR